MTPSFRRARVTEAEHLDVMGHVLEAVLFSRSLGPSLDRLVLDLDRVPTRTADQVMVMDLSVTTPVDGLAILPAHSIDHSALAECLEGPVNRRQSNLVVSRSQLIVQFLRTAETGSRRKRSRDRSTLAGGLGTRRRGSFSLGRQRTVIRSRKSEARPKAMMLESTMVAAGATST